MAPPLKRILHLGGGLLAVLGVGFVVQRLAAYGGELSLDRFDTAIWWWLTVLAIIYGCANLWLVAAWRDILRSLGINRTWRWSISTYGISQIAKYVPGNVLHVAGRQAMGMAAGIAAVPLLKSSIVELALLFCAGCLFAIPLLPSLVPSIPQLPPVPATLTMVAVGMAVLHKLRGRFAMRAFGWYFLFLCCSGACFIGVLELVAGDLVKGDIPLSIACAAYVIAWLIGLVTPGAPAGIGVRELALMLFLGDMIAEADLILAVALGRGVTTLGDLGLFVAASFLSRTEESQR